jgi:molybdenum cofactor cytidylyltransferase
MIAAVIPAAGRSARMGQPKLLLTFHGQTLIERVVNAVRAGGVDRVLVVAPPCDAPEGPGIARNAQRAGARVIVPDAQPAEMRASVELALEALSRDHPPDSVLLTPGDNPGLSSHLVSRVVEAAARLPGSIVVPCCDGSRGHPVVLPWSVALELRSLPPGTGVNALVARRPHAVVELPVPHPEIALDLNTPQDLLRWQESVASRARYHVRLFALARERAGRSDIEIELPARARVADLRAALRTQLPELERLIVAAMVAVDEEYADDAQPLSPGARIALIPPVSGGGPPCSSWEFPLSILRWPCTGRARLR